MKTVVLICALAVFVLAGCGGGASDNSPSATVSEADAGSSVQSSGTGGLPRTHNDAELPGLAKFELPKGWVTAPIEPIPGGRESQGIAAASSRKMAKGIAAGEDEPGLSLSVTFTQIYEEAEATSPEAFVEKVISDNSAYFAGEPVRLAGQPAAFMTPTSENAYTRLELLRGENEILIVTRDRDGTHTAEAEEAMSLVRDSWEWTEE